MEALWFEDLEHNKARASKSAGKVVAIVFVDIEGIMYKLSSS